MDRLQRRPMHYAPNIIHESYATVGMDEGLPLTSPLHLMYLNVGNELYHSMTGISSSNFNDILEDLPGFVAGVDAFEDDVPKDHFVLGEMVHTSALEPDKPNKFAPYPGKVRRGKQWEQFKADCEAAALIPVTEAMRSQADCMLESLDECALLGKYLESSYNETSGWINDPWTGILCKVRPDILFPTTENEWHIVDLKTSRCPTWEGKGRHNRGFKFSVQNYGYDRQAAFYIDMLKAMGFKVSGFTFLVVGKEPPYEVHEHSLPKAWIDEARKEYRGLLEKYKRYIIYG